MDSKLQIISLGVSFGYGVIFYLLTRFNKYIISNTSNWFKLLISIVFVIDIVVLYIYIMYNINLGVIHPYFIAVLIIGYIGMYWCYDKVRCKIVVKVKKTLK